MKTMTTNSANSLIGKTISWEVKGYKGQNYSGIAIIEEVDENAVKPLKTKTLEGNDLNYAFNEWGAGERLDAPICYSDGDRYILYNVIDEN